MKSLSLTLKIFATAIFTLSLCTVVQAIPRTWVSGTGNDANPCTRTLPCATFAGAIVNTDAGGEINALDPGDYSGSFVINKTITIDGGAGQVASMRNPVGTAIVISIVSSNTVVLRNITINGVDTGTTGIQYNGTGGQLFMENVTIERFNGDALIASGTNPASPLLAEIDNCRFKSNLTGIHQLSYTVIGLRNSVITGTSHKGVPPNSFGVNMTPPAGTTASIKLENNEISFCQSALRAVGSDLGGGVPLLWLRGNHIYRNMFAANFTVNVQYFTDLSNKLSDNANNVVGGMAFALPSM